MNIHKKKPGRPPGNKILRRLRSQTWLLAVQSKCGGRNNCQLDRIFGPRDQLGNMLGTAERLKMFEAIKSAEVRELVVECVSLLNLVELPQNHTDDDVDERKQIVSNEPLLTIEEYFERQKEFDHGYDLLMGDVLPYSNPNLDHIALVGALALEAIHAGNMKIASYQIDIFKTYLKGYCNQGWLSEIAKELYQYAETRMLKALNTDVLKGLPNYSTMLSALQGAGPNSAIDTLLTRHQRMLWRR